MMLEQASLRTERVASLVMLACVVYGGLTGRSTEQHDIPGCVRYGVQCVESTPVPTQQLGTRTDITDIISQKCKKCKKCKKTKNFGLLPRSAKSAKSAKRKTRAQKKKIGLLPRSAKSAKSAKRAKK